MSAPTSAQDGDFRVASASVRPEPISAEAFEQRHFRSWLNSWSDWYPSSVEAYREHVAGPVKQYEVRRVR